MVRKNNFKFHILLIFLVLAGIMQQFSVVYAEEITNENETIKYPTYEIFNYPDSVTNGQRATWGVTQGEDGRMYFANNAGVLMFDGTNWRIIQTEMLCGQDQLQKIMKVCCCRHIRTLA